MLKTLLCKYMRHETGRNYLVCSGWFRQVRTNQSGKIICFWPTIRIRESGNTFSTEWPVHLESKTKKCSEKPRQTRPDMEANLATRNWFSAQTCTSKLAFSFVIGSFGECSNVFRRARAKPKTQTLKIQVNSAKKRLNQMRSSVNLKIRTFDMIHSQFFSENNSVKERQSSDNKSHFQPPSTPPAKFVQVNEFIFQILALVYDFDTAIVKSGGNIEFHPKDEVLLKIPKAFKPDTNQRSLQDLSMCFSENQSETDGGPVPVLHRSRQAWPEAPGECKRRSLSVRSFLDCGSSGMFGSQVNTNYLMSLKPSALFSKAPAQKKQFRFKQYLQGTDLGANLLNCRNHSTHLFAESGQLRVYS